MSISTFRLYGTIVLWFIITIRLMVSAAYLWVFIYSIFVQPGGDHAFYEAYAQKASPVVAVVTALPVFYMMGRYIRRFDSQASFAVSGVVVLHLIMEVGVLLSLDEAVSNMLLFSVASAVCKVLGAYLAIGAKSRPLQT